jgi:glycosyltransferase involved in cell wall biosynthesis
MKISVITVTYNSALTIVDTVDSVLGQTHSDLEYLIVDGASKDATLEKLEPYRDRLAGLFSEPDRGMYDAMNKGIARTNGDIVAILNSDDVYANPEVLSKVAACFETSGADCVYGDLHYVSSDLKRVVRNWRSGSKRPGAFRRGWHPPHPSFFVKRAAYRDSGGYKIDLSIAADYECMLRLLEKEARSVAYLAEVLVKMRTGGASNRSIGNILRANHECYRAWRMQGYDAVTAAYAICRKLLSKLRQLRTK